MRTTTLLLLAALATATYAAGQYYVPRSYYLIDQEGHESQPVPLRRLRRSLDPYPYLNRRVARSPDNPSVEHGGSTHARVSSSLWNNGGWKDIPGSFIGKP